MIDRFRWYSKYSSLGFLFLSLCACIWMNPRTLYIYMSYWVGGWRPSFHFVKLWPSFTSSSFASPPANPTTAQGGVSFFLVVPSVSDWSLGMVQPMSPFEVTSTLKYLAAWPSSIWPLSGANKVLRRVSHIYIYILYAQSTTRTAGATRQRSQH